MINTFNFIITWIVYPSLLTLFFAVLLFSGYYVILGIKLSFDRLFSVVCQRWHPGAVDDGSSGQPLSPLSYASANVSTKETEGDVKVLETIPPPEKYRRPRNRSIATCAICLEDLMDGELCQTLPECQHAFHSPCIKPWLIQMQNCPICRQSFSVV